MKGEGIMNIDIWKRVLVGIYVEEDNMSIIEDLPFTNISEQEMAPIKTLAHQIKVLMTKVYNTIKDIAVEYHSVHIVSEKTTMMSWYYDPEHPVTDIFKAPNEWKTLSTESEINALLSETDPQRIIDICVKPLENIRNRLQYICALIAKYSDDGDDDSKELIQKCINGINEIISEIPTYPNVPESLATNDIARRLVTVYANAEYKDKVRMWKQISEWLNLDVNQLIEHKDENRYQPIIPQVEGCGPLSAPGMNEKLTKEYFEDKKAEKAEKAELKRLKKMVSNRPPRVKIPTSEDEAKTFIKYDNGDYVKFWETVDDIMIHLARIYRWTDEVITAVTHWKGLISYVGYKKSCDGTRAIRGTIKEWYKPLVASLKEISASRPVPSGVEAKYLNSDPDKIDSLLSGDEPLIISGILEKNPDDILDVYNDIAFYYPTIKDIWHRLDLISKAVEAEHRKAMVGLMNALLNIISDLVVAEKISDKSICGITLVRTVDTEAKVLACATMREIILHVAVINETVRRLEACGIKHSFGKLRTISERWFENLTKLDLEYAKVSMNRAGEIVEIAKDGRVPMDDIEKSIRDRFNTLYDELDKYLDFVSNVSEEYKITYSVFNEVITYGRINGYFTLNRFA